MKNLLAFILILTVTGLSAQNEKEPESHKFRRDNIFIGGSIGLGFSSGSFSVGANPEIGYSIAQWLDAGVSTNINYFSIRPDWNNNYVRQRSFNYGGGLFVRVFPIRNVFIQLLPEYNIINTTLTRIAPGVEEESIKLKQQAPSFLAGIGYGTREIGSGSFYTVLMMDLGNNTQSPYIEYAGSKRPILRAGFNFYLRPSKK